MISQKKKQKKQTKASGYNWDKLKIVFCLLLLLLLLFLFCFVLFCFQWSGSRPCSYYRGYWTGSRLMLGVFSNANDNDILPHKPPLQGTPRPITAIRIWPIVSFEDVKRTLFPLNFYFQSWWSFFQKASEWSAKLIWMFQYQVKPYFLFLYLVT